MAHDETENGRRDGLSGMTVTPEPAVPAPRPQASAQMKADLIAVIPNLRAFAVSLCGNPDRADDLVQETLVKAWSNLGSFRRGHQPAGLALHHPAQHLLFGISQAPPRGRRHGRRDRRQARRRARAARPHGFPRFPLGAAAAADRPARGADPHRRLRHVLRRGGQRLQLRRRHDEEPRQPRPQPPLRHAGARRQRRVRQRRRLAGDRPDLPRPAVSRAPAATDDGRPNGRRPGRFDNPPILFEEVAAASAHSDRIAP